MTASAPRKYWRYALRSGWVRSATMRPGTGVPSAAVARTSMGTRSQRSPSSLNMRWAMYPEAPVRTTRRLAMASLLHPLPELEAPDLAAVDFVGAVGEAQRARMGPHGGQREGLADAATAVDLHGAVDHSQRHVRHRDLDLGDRLLGSLVAHGVHHPGRVEHQQPRLIDLDARLGDALERDVVLAQPLAEGHPLVGALAHELERALGHADLTHAVVDAAGAESALGDLEAATLAEQHVRRRYPDVLEEHLAVAVGRIVVAEDGQHAPDRDAGRVARDEDHRLLLVAVGVLGVRLAHEDEDLAAWVADARGPPLVAVDDVVIALAHDRRFDVGGVGRRHLRLGHGEGRADLPL